MNTESAKTGEKTNTGSVKSDEKIDTRNVKNAKIGVRPKRIGIWLVIVGAIAEILGACLVNLVYFLTYVAPAVTIIGVLRWAEEGRARRNGVSIKEARRMADYPDMWRNIVVGLGLFTCFGYIFGYSLLNLMFMGIGAAAGYGLLLLIILVGKATQAIWWTCLVAVALATIIFVILSIKRRRQHWANYILVVEGIILMFSPLMISQIITNIKFKQYGVKLPRPYYSMEENSSSGFTEEDEEEDELDDGLEGEDEADDSENTDEEEEDWEDDWSEDEDFDEWELEEDW